LDKIRIRSLAELWQSFKLNVTNVILLAEKFLYCLTLDFT